MIPHSRPTIEADDIAAVQRVMATGFVAQGPEVRAFEEEAAAYLGRRGGVATTSGTSALHLALLVLGVGPGDEVLIPSYACVALLHVVNLTGARARIVDCAPHSVNMSAADAAAKLSPATKAVILPHMFGTAASMTEFRRLGVPIIENCAQSLGATLDGRPLGSFGDVTVLSFYATKMITTGEGGMLLSDADMVLEHARDLRDYDKRPDYRLRFNYKMTDMQAAMGRSQLRKLPRFVERRQAVARRYQQALPEGVCTYTPVRAGDACYRFVVHVPEVDAFSEAMWAHRVECKRPVYHLLHLLAEADHCPSAEEVFRHGVSIPIYPSLTDDEVNRIGMLVAEAAGGPAPPARVDSARIPPQARESLCRNSVTQ